MIMVVQCSWTDPRSGEVVVQTEFTPLHVAAQEDCAAAVDALLRLGADVGVKGALKWPNGEKSSGAVPLYVALRGGCLAVVSTLLRHRSCSVDARTTVGGLFVLRLRIRTLCCVKLSC